jgi:hypothetical protein
MTSDESVLKDDTPQKSATEIERLRQNLGAEKFAQIEGLANRFYEANRSVLDEAHANAIISDEDYKKCLSRGNEFAPACFIMSDLVRAGRINLDPFEAAQSTIGEAVEGDKPLPEIADEDIPF